MLAEMDIVIFLKAHEEFAQIAERLFGMLGSEFTTGSSEEWGGEYAEARGIGFRAVLFANTGELQDPEFEAYRYAMAITSNYWCVDVDDELEGTLSDYFARQLAFDLDVETSTEILVDTAEEGEVFEIRAYRRNPQFRLDQAPTVPKVYVIETRQVVEPYEDDEEWEEDPEEEERR